MKSTLSMLYVLYVLILIINYYNIMIHDYLLPKFCNIPSLFSQHHLTHIVC